MPTNSSALKPRFCPQDVDLSLLFFFFVLLQDYKPEEDPALFQSVKTGRGPLSPEWKVPGPAAEQQQLSLRLRVLD